ncbi:reverse transcriptase domain-containing protein [Tanacetum coccineum]
MNDFQYRFCNELSIDVTDEILEEDFDALLDEGSKILHSIEGTLLEEEIFAEFDEFMAMTVDENSDSESDTKDPPFEKITINTDYKIKTSIEEPPTNLELKPLPDNLEYVFLKELSFLPVIISSQLSKEKKNKLISVLKKHKQAFAWKTTDIPGICPSFCKHKIQLLDDKKPVVQKQRRLNPNMKKVAKKEIMKLLDTGIIYPIADSPWVSPIHCVPKKGGITVVTNENDELVPTRTITGWRVSSAGLEVDKTKIDVISKLPPPTNIKGIRIFLGHAIFYRRFIKDFLKIARPLTKLLKKDTPFEFNDECQKAFELLKERLACAPVIVSPNWNLPFKLMYDASDFAVRGVLGQKDEFDIEIKDRKGTKNVAADHLSLLENDETSDDSEVDDNFPGETLMEINTKNEPWFADFAKYLVGDIIPKGMSRCISGPETRTILDQSHHGPIGGHYGPNITAKKVLDSGFYWPSIIKEAHTLVRLCDACQKTENISKRDEMPLNNIQCTSAIRQLTYDVNASFLDEYMQISERSSRKALDHFCQVVMEIYGPEYLRKPTVTDVEKLYRHHNEKHGFPRMLGSLDCTDWEWFGCPYAFKAQYVRRDHGSNPFILLKVVVSQDLWIWHAFFSVVGSNNDINILYQSPLFNDLKTGRAPKIPFVANGVTYPSGYYLVDGIYPELTTLVKTIPEPADDDHKRILYKQKQESVRKDVERAFGVLKKKCAILVNPTRALRKDRIVNMMYTCIILHNMIRKYKKVAISPRWFPEEAHQLEDMLRNEEQVQQVMRWIRSSQVHQNLRHDLIEHLAQNA